MGNLQSWLKIVREHWLLATSAVLVTVLAAGLVWLLRPAEYTGRITLYVSAQTADTAQTAYQGSLLSQQRVTSYVELVTSERVTRGVIERFGLAATPEEVAEEIKASTTLDSVLIQIDVTSESPEQAAAMANVVGGIFIDMVNELDRPASPTVVPPVAVRVVQPAIAPLLPSSPTLPVTLALGFIVGLALGVGAAFARNAVDNSVKTLEQLRGLTASPNLGSIAFDSNVPKHPLTILEDPQSPHSEAFRHLRTNLQFVDVDNAHRVVVVSSSMPEEGKTTTLSNLAIAMSSTGSRILVIEADLRRPKLADLFGFDRAVGLTNVLAGTVPFDQAVQPWAGGKLDVLASGPLPPNPSELLASKQMADLLRHLGEIYDAVLVDTPPLLPVTDAAAVAPAADGVILVCRFKQTRRDQLRAATEALRAVGAPLFGTVLTMVPTSGPGAYARYNSYYQIDPAQLASSQTAPSPARRPSPVPRAGGAASIPTALDLRRRGTDSRSASNGSFAQPER